MMGTFVKPKLQLLFLITVAAQAHPLVLSKVLLPLETKRQARSSFYGDEPYGGVPRGFIDDRRCSRCYQHRPLDNYGENTDQFDDRRKLRPAYGNTGPAGGGRLDEERRQGDKRNGTPYVDDVRRNRPPLRPYDDRRYDDRYDRRYQDDYDAYPTRPRGDYDAYPPRQRGDYDRYPLVRDPYYEDYRRRGYDRFDEPYPRYDAYDDYRGRPAYDDYPMNERGNGYDDRGYGMRQRYPMAPQIAPDRYDSFRPWDETNRGVSGFDDVGRGYYFASGRPEYGSGGGVSSGWHSVNEKPRNWKNPSRWDPNEPSGNSSPRPAAYPQQDNPGQNGQYGANNGNFGQNSQYGSNNGNFGPAGSTSTTPGNSYLYQRENERVTDKTSKAMSTEKTTK